MIGIMAAGVIIFLLYVVFSGLYLIGRRNT